MMVTVSSRRGRCTNNNLSTILDATLIWRRRSDNEAATSEDNGLSGFAGVNLRCSGSSGVAGVNGRRMARPGTQRSALSHDDAGNRSMSMMGGQDMAKCVSCSHAVPQQASERLSRRQRKLVKRERMASGSEFRLCLNSNRCDGGSGSGGSIRERELRCMLRLLNRCDGVLSVGRIVESLRWSLILVIPTARLFVCL
jgi:hypothetical protein